MGRDDPTRAAFPFSRGLVLSEAAPEVQTFLLAEATSLMRKTTANAMLPVGWPPLGETLEKLVARHIQVLA
jgi:predicted peroxiredoxin